jgi:outer membrane protein assembly factor BamB
MSDQPHITPPPPSAEPGPKSSAARCWQKAASRCGIIAAVITAGMAAVLAAAFTRQLATHITAPADVRAMRQQLTEEPYNATLRVELRRRDLALRQDYFQRTQFLRVGSVLLTVFAGLTVAAVAASVFVGKWYPPAPEDPAQAEAAWRSRDYATVAVATGAILLAVGAWAFSRPDTSGFIEPPPPLQLNWPRFRGPGGLGQAPTQQPLLPGMDGAKVLWKSRIPIKGKNSPIGWGNTIFLTGATKNERAVMAFEASTGRLAWQTPVPAMPDSPAEAPEAYQDTGYAAATGCTDGERFYAIFANGDLLACDFTGRVAWSRALGAPANQYGLAASLLKGEGHLFVPFDQLPTEDDPPQSRSRLLALDPASGETRWAVERDVPDSWTTPIIAQTPSGPQLITAANPWVIAYHPADGQEIWRANLLSGDVAPSPVYAAGNVVVTMEGAGLFAIRTDGTGDVTDTHVHWAKTEAMAPDIISPLATDEHILLLSSYGQLLCFDAESGEQLWTHDYGQSFYASPLLLADGQVLLVSAAGEMFVIRLGETFEEVGKASLGESVSATPLPGGEHIFIRGERHLFCIGRTADTTNTNE